MNEEGAAIDEQLEVRRPVDVRFNYDSLTEKGGK